MTRTPLKEQMLPTNLPATVFGTMSPYLKELHDVSPYLLHTYFGTFDNRDGTGLELVPLEPNIFLRTEYFEKAAFQFQVTCSVEKIRAGSKEPFTKDVGLTPGKGGSAESGRSIVIRV